MKPLNIAHRGASIHALENSREAFEKAVDVGADMIELDIQLTSDGVPIVLHDASLDRTTTGHGPLAPLSLADLREVQLINGESIPTLDEVLSLFKGRIQFDLEVKAAGAISEVVKLVKDHGMEDDVLVTSFHPDAIAYVNGQDTPMRNALLIGQPTLNLGVRLNEAFPFFWLRKARTKGISIHYSVLPERLLGWLRKWHYDIYIWTVDARPIMEKYYASYIDGIITNRPDVMAALIEERGECEDGEQVAPVVDEAPDPGEG